MNSPTAPHLLPAATGQPVPSATTIGNPASAGRELIRAHDIGVQRAGRWLIQGVNLSIRSGEIVTLIGPNGSGKSTTARVVLGLEKPDQGHVERAAGSRIGYVPQRLQVDSSLPMTVTRLMTLTRHYDSVQIERALAAVGMADLQSRQVHDLSGGEFQRALLARAMIAEPDLLVLDEPVQGVDFTGEIQLYELIGRLRDTTHCGILLISHDLHVVMAHSDRVICLNGHVCCHGSPESVADDPEYIRLFGQRGARSLAIYRHEHDHTHGPDGTIEHAHDCAGGDH